MRFALLVALSHLRSRRREQGISVITFVSMLGVMVGVTALIMVLAVMEKDGCGRIVCSCFGELILNSMSANAYIFF